jgi:alcohol dehydrogenase YqhD (iron-dependent ADH family)
MNNGAVITNEKTRQKFNIKADSLSPKVSILDPVNTYTVPGNYTAYGCVDAMVHLLEGYFTQEDPNTSIQDGFVETLVKTLMESTRTIMKKADDYNARADFMWAATLALNGITTAGIGNHGFPNHMMGHSLSALYDIAHGASLSIVFPAWLKHHAKEKSKKISRFGTAIFGIEDPQKTIEALEQFFNSIGTSTRLSQVNIPATDIDKIAGNAVMLAQKWRLDQYTKGVITAILQLGA